MVNFYEIIQNANDEFDAQIGNIRVTTRLQKRKAAEKLVNEAPLPDDRAKRPPVYQMLNKNAIDAKVPVLQFEYDEKDDLFATVRQKGRHTLITFDTASSIRDMLLTVEESCNSLNIEEIILYEDDVFFERFTLLELFGAGKTLTKLTIMLLKAPLTITSEKKKKELVEIYHDNPIYGGHCGQKRLLSKLRRDFTWRGMSRDVANHVKSCPKCQINKHRATNKPLSTIVPTPNEPFQTILMDLIGPITSSLNNNSYALTILCELTKYLVVIPLRNKEATTVAKAFIDDFLLIYGPPRAVRTDCGSEFVNKLFEEVTKLMNIEHKTSVPYHPQTIAPLERNHGVLNAYLRSFMNENQQNWDVYAKYFGFHWNISPIPYLNDYSPFELVFNRRVLIPELLKSDISPLYNADNLAQLTRYRLQTAHKFTRKWIEEIKRIQKKSLDEKSRPMTFNMGDKVLITDKTRNKMDPVFEGPFVVIEIEHPNVVLQDETKRLKVHLDRVIKFTERY